MSYSSHAANNAVIDKSKPFVFGMHKLLAERTKNLAPGQSKKPLIGSWSMLPGANLARMIASQGFDFILVDCEHGNISDSEMHSIVAAIGNTPGCSPMIRIPAPESYLVKRALDTGAHALMCPLVSTAEEARRFVSYAKFPQRKANRPPADVLTRSKFAALPGVRGAGSPFAPALWKMEMKDYFDVANEGIFLAVQIETEEGLKNCEEIAQVEGIGESFKVFSGLG
jgi:4-hydroxy-2-oxoheptanedioate aldolase